MKPVKLIGSALGLALGASLLSTAALAQDLSIAVAGPMTGGDAKMGLFPQTDLTARLSLGSIPLAQLLKPVPGASERAAGRFSGNVDFRAPVASVRETKTWVADGTLTADSLRVFDRTVDLDGVPDGYRAMNEREALKVLIRPW